MPLITSTPHVDRDHETVIEARGASIGYDGVPVVKDLDLTIDCHEVVGLLGPNGSGKSTLVKGILGLTPVLGGDLRVFGRSVNRFREHDRIGYVPQRQTVTGGVPSTVREIVATGRLGPFRFPPRWSRREDRTAIDTAIAAVGLEDKANHNFNHLSGGQQRRALIARALASKPEFLILDEPTAGVDRENQVLLAESLAKIVDAGATILLITHELGPVERLVTRAIVLDEGRIAHDGDPTHAPDEHHDDDWHHDDHGRHPSENDPGIGLVSP